MPRVNHEIWFILPNKAKQSDVHWQSLQASVSQTSVSKAKMADKVVSEGSILPGTWQADLLQMILETASINNATNQTIIQQRKKEMKPFVSSEASVICSSTNTTTELLFGDNFQDEIKASKSAMGAVKPKTYKGNGPLRSSGGSFHRTAPYRRTPGNYQRPHSNFGTRGQSRPQLNQQYLSQTTKPNFFQKRMQTK